MKKELTKTKLHNILKKYRLERELLEKDWEKTCQKVSMRSTETSIAVPSIYQHEAHSSKGRRLFMDIMKEFDGYDVFPEKDEP